MKVVLGKDGLKESFQQDFPESVECPKCKGKADIAFVAHELTVDDLQNVCDLHKTTGERGGLWPHDSCAVAVYLCRNCLEPVAKFNQG